MAQRKFRPHAAATRAVIGLRKHDAADTAQAITREYAPLVREVERLLWQPKLRAALRKVLE